MERQYQLYRPMIICQLQVIDPYHQHPNLMAKVRFTPKDCYRLRLRLERAVQDHVPRADPKDKLFLDYAKYQVYDTELYEKAVSNGDKPIDMLVGMLLQQKGQRPPDLYFRKNRTGRQMIVNTQRNIRRRGFNTARQQLRQAGTGRRGYAPALRARRTTNRRNIPLGATINPRGAGRPRGTFTNLGLNSMGGNWFPRGFY
jgi:hypothetical protein